MNERITTAFRLAGRSWTPGPVPADMPEDALAWARANGLLAPENKAHAAAPKKAVKPPARHSEEPKATKNPPPVAGDSSASPQNDSKKETTRKG